MRIAATGDLHFTPQGYAKLKDQFERVLALTKPSHGAAERPRAMFG